MKLGTVALVGAGLYGVYYLSQLGTAAGTVNINFVGINIKGLTNLELVLNVQNVSNVGITVKSMTGNVMVNNRPLGSVSFFGGIEVPANGEVNIPVRLNISILDLPSDIADFINKGGPPAEFEVTGFVNMNGFVMPYDMQKVLAI